MRRHTISLALICKNEIHNFPRLLESVEGCFDEIHVCDTGSTDGTWEYLCEMQKRGMKDGSKLVLKQFEWIDDFAAARNASYKDITTDYVMWLDLDDSLSDKEAFIQWRNVAMPLCDYWLSPYRYAYEGNKPVITFMRERVIKTSFNPTWQYFVHEGIPPSPGMRIQNINSWQVNHQRSVKDLEADKGRNLRIFEKKIAQGVKLCPRMQFYYGKEFFENGDHLNAWKVLEDVVGQGKLEQGDRMLALQYLANTCLLLNKPQTITKAIDYCRVGLMMDPLRAEYRCIIGDAYLVQNRFHEAKIEYIAALETPNRAPADGKRHEFIYHVAACHGVYPHKQLLKCLFNLGEFEKVKAEGEHCLKLYGPDEEVSGILKAVEDAIRQTSRDESKIIQTDEVVFSTPPMAAYEWDDSIYETKGVGGSETACIEIAKWIRRLTNKPVIIFAQRRSPYISPDGVEYRPITELNNYFSKFKPELHIAWRHNIKLTSAPTYVWSHDLVTHNGEDHQNYDGMLILSEFHKQYIRALQQVPLEKLLHTRNGIVLDRFKDTGVQKNPNKIVWPSSPDRGLERAISIVEKARETNPNLELHVYYGFENLRKYNMGALADSLDAQIKSKPWIKYHGNVDQKTLARELQEAVVWLYPANFIESFCITALECLAARCFPIVRSLGALPYTLHEASLKTQALLIDRDAVEKEDIEFWSGALLDAIEMEHWKRIDMDMTKHSWESVAREWCQLFGLEIEDFKISQKLSLVQAERPLYNDDVVMEG